MDSKNSNIKILIATHKPAKFPEGKYFVPIHVGRDVALKKSKDGKLSKKDFDWLIKNTIGDNTGDNISLKNRYFNEISALYWAWKNYDELGNPDYIGLMHYRRHFVFNDKYYKQKLLKTDIHNRGIGIIIEKYVSKKYIQNIGLNDKNIEILCNNYDAIVSYYTNLTLSYGKPESLRTDYVNNISGMKAEDFDLMVEIIKQKYPKYSNAINEYINGDKKLSFQMFIMKKELFFEYCDFLFSILSEIDNQRNWDNYTINGKRTLGYLGEIMLNIFFIIKDNDNLKLKQVGTAFIQGSFPRNFWITKIKKCCKKCLSIICNIKI